MKNSVGLNSSDGCNPSNSPSFRSIENFDDLFNETEHIQPLPNRSQFHSSSSLAATHLNCAAQEQFSQSNSRPTNSTVATTRHQRTVSFQARDGTRRRISTSQDEADEETETSFSSSIPNSTTSSSTSSSSTSSSGDDSSGSTGMTLATTSNGDLNKTKEREVSQSDFSRTSASFQSYHSIDSDKLPAPIPHPPKSLRSPTQSSSSCETSHVASSNSVVSATSAISSRGATSPKRLEQTPRRPSSSSLPSIVPERHVASGTTGISTVRFVRSLAEPDGWSFVIHLRTPVECIPEPLPVTNLEWALVRRLRRECGGGASYAGTILKVAVIAKRRARAIREQRKASISLLKYIHASFNVMKCRRSVFWTTLVDVYR